MGGAGAFTRIECGIGISGYNKTATCPSGQTIIFWAIRNYEIHEKKDANSGCDINVYQNGNGIACARYEDDTSHCGGVGLGLCVNN